MIRGSCFCGKITYTVSGQLSKARSCHCSRCRKAFSSQASAYAEIEEGSFTWTSGQHLLKSYTNKHGFGLQFCSLCGSTLCGTHNDKVHGLTLGCLDDDPNIEIEMHIYVGSKANWEKLPENILKYDERPQEHSDESRTK